VGNQNNKYLTNEKDLPPDLEFVDRPPIVTGSTPSAAPPPKSVDRYQGAILSAPLGLQTDIEKSQLPGALPVYRLMPSAPSGQPNTNSGVHSNAAPLIFPVASAAQNAQTTATAAQETADAVAAVSFQGAWSNTTSYSQGASVTGSDGKIYVSLVNNNIGHDPTTDGGVHWQAAGTEVFLGAWNSGTAYAIGNVVSVSTQLFFALQNNTNQNPTSTTGFWQLLNPGTIAAWNSGTAYLAEQLVTKGGFVFSALQNSTNQTPPTPPATNAFWQNLGPTSVDPSTSYVLAKGSLPPTLSNSYSYTSTATSATVTNNGQNILRADGTLTSVPNGSQAITGLLASKSYYLYPYWDETLLSQNFVSSSSSIPNLPGVTENGSTGFVSTTTSTSQSAGSIEAWFRTTSGVSGMLVELNPNQTGAPNTTTSYFGLEVRGTGAVVGIPAHAGANTSGIAYNDGVWHHAVMTCVGGAGGAVNVYVDGVLTNTGSATISAVAGFWRMGSGGATGSSFFLNGTVAHVAVYSSVLSAAQIANHYSVMTASGPTAYATIVANDGASFYWKLNETVGTTAADSIGTNTGTYQTGSTLNQSQAVLSPVGSPAIAWTQPSSGAAQQQNLQGFVPLSTGAITIATPASGSAGGNSSGGATPSCFSGNTLVVTKNGNRRFDELTTDDEVLTAKQTWKRIKEILVHDYKGPVHDIGNGEFVTPDHLILYDSEWVKTGRLYIDWQEFEGKVHNLIVETDEPLDQIQSTTTERSYTLANGTIAHNAKIFR
jgi:hypothetical protein